MPVAQRREGELVSVFGAAHENGVGEPLVDERPVGPQVSDDSTGAAGGGCTRPTLDARAPATRRRPACRCAGAFGREYH